MNYTEILLIRDNYAVQCNNMTLLVVTVKQYEVRVLTLIVLFKVVIFLRFENYLEQLVARLRLLVADFCERQAVHLDVFNIYKFV